MTAAQRESPAAPSLGDCGFHSDAQTVNAQGGIRCFYTNAHDSMQLLTQSSGKTAS
jgi:hypothetical protein